MKPRILFITNLYPNSAEPGRGLYIRQLVARLRSDFEIRVIAPIPWLPLWMARRWRPEHAVPPVEEIENVVVYHPRYFVIPKLLRFTHGFTYALCASRMKRRIVRDFPYQLISVHWMFPDTYGTVMAGQSDGVPIVAHALGCDINDYLGYPLRRRMIAWALSHTDAVVTKSSEIAAKVQALGIDKSRIWPIHNGVDRELFSFRADDTVRRSLGLPDDEKVILFIGNFSVEKGIEYLLQAFSRIRRERNDVMLCLVGDGPLQESINKRIQSLGLENCTSLQGRIAHDRIPDFLRAADVLCLPSLREGCPNVVLESLASGTPVAASSVGAIPEMAERSQICFMSDPADVRALQGNLLRAIDLPHDISRSFDWPSWEDNAVSVGRIFKEYLRCSNTPVTK